MLKYFKDPPRVKTPSTAGRLAQTITLCQLCDRNSIQWKCVECAELFCTECRKIHQRGKATRSHKVVSVKDINEEIVETSALNLNCPRHNFVCSMFCATCIECACANCVTDNHIGHTFQDLKSLLDKRKREINKVLGDIDSKYVPQLQCLLDNRQPDHGNDDVARARSELEQRRRSLKQAIDETVDHHLHELSRFSSDRKENKARSEQDMKRQLKEILEKRNSLRKMVKPMNANDVTVLVTSSNTYLNIKPSATIAHFGHVQFRPGSLSEDDIHQGIGSLGFAEERFENAALLQQQPNTGEREIIPDEPSWANEDNASLVQQRSYEEGFRMSDGDEIVKTVQLTKNQNLKPLKTGLSSVTSISLVPNGTLWVGCASTRRLEVINPTNRALDVPPVITNVVGFSLNKRGDLFVADLDNCKIRKREHPSGKLTLIKEFKPLQPVSVYVNENTNMVYVGLVDTSGRTADDQNNINGSIVMVSMKGEVHSTIGNGRPTNFKIPNRLTFCHVTNSLIVIDSLVQENGRIVSISKDNSVQFTYNPVQNNTLNTFNPTDVVCSMSGQVIICDHGNDLLHVIDANGLLEYYIDTKSCGIERPWSLALSPDNKMYVGTVIYKDGKRTKDAQKGVVYVVDVEIQ